jgi:hypothetical protein
MRKAATSAHERAFPVPALGILLTHMPRCAACPRHRKSRQETTGHVSTCVGARGSCVEACFVMCGGTCKEHSADFLCQVLSL